MGDGAVILYGNICARVKYVHRHSVGEGRYVIDKRNRRRRRRWKQEAASSHQTHDGSSSYKSCMTITQSEPEHTMRRLRMELADDRVSALILLYDYSQVASTNFITISQCGPEYLQEADSVNIQISALVSDGNQHKSSVIGTPTKYSGKLQRSFGMQRR